MATRGGYRERRYILPHELPIYVPSGRWGPRRARAELCLVILRAEAVYDQLIRAGTTFGPGTRLRLECRSTSAPGYAWAVRAEVLSNTVWSRGRLFLRCETCDQRATRLYVPVLGLDPRCRRCWGLSYVSQSWCYKPVGILGSVLGPVAHGETDRRRQARRKACRERQKARRGIIIPSCADL